VAQIALLRQRREERKETDVVGNNGAYSGLFTIKVRAGNVEVEVSAPDKEFVLDESKNLFERFKIDTPALSPTQVEMLPGEVATLVETAQNKKEKPQTLGEFFRQFVGLQTNLDKILVLGYWCEIKQGQSHFTTEDIVAKYKEIREKPPANINRDLGTLISKGLLLPPDKSEDGTQTYSLSRSGIQEVESKMPQE
jgi:hypothetical protein